MIAARARNRPAHRPDKKPPPPGKKAGACIAARQALAVPGRSGPPADRRQRIGAGPATPRPLACSASPPRRRMVSAARPGTACAARGVQAAVKGCQPPPARLRSLGAFPPSGLPRHRRCRQDRRARRKAGDRHSPTTFPIRKRRPSGLHNRQNRIASAALLCCDVAGHRNDLWLKLPPLRRSGGRRKSMMPAACRWSSCARPARIWPRGLLATTCCQ